MTITDILNGGPWVIAVGLAWAVSTGKLRLGREVVALEAQLDALRTDFKNATSRLTAAQDQQNQARDEQLAAANRRAEEIGSRLDAVLAREPDRPVGREREGRP